MKVGNPNQIIDFNFKDDIDQHSKNDAIDNHTILRDRFQCAIISVLLVRGEAIKNGFI